MEQPKSRILLPLRTSVDLFSDPAQPSALTRAKQAAVLHDTVVVEIGFLDVSLTQHGGMQWWTPPEQMTAEHISRARRPPQRGEPITIAFGVQPGPGQPPSQMSTMVSGDISMAYAAEWHTEVLDPLAALGVDFVETVSTGGGSISISTPLGRAISWQNHLDMSDKSLLPGVNSFERSFVYEAFNRDIGVARDIDAVLQVSSLFEPMLQRHGRPAIGDTALQIAVPNLGRLEWEQVVAFREHPGCEEAREMLREFERAAAEQDAGDAEDFLLKVSQEMSNHLFAALEERNTNLPRAIAEEAAKTAVSLFPVVGPFAEGAITATQLGAAKYAEARSGIAALMKLRRA
jgi:hypothetical protein